MAALADHSGGEEVTATAGAGTTCRNAELGVCGEKWHREKLSWKDIAWKDVFSGKIDAPFLFCRSGLIRKDLCAAFVPERCRPRTVVVRSRSQLVSLLSSPFPCRELWCLKRSDSSNANGLRFLILPCSAELVRETCLAAFPLEEEEAGRRRYILQRCVDPPLLVTLGKKKRRVKFHVRILLIVAGFPIKGYCHRSSCRALLATEEYKMAAVAGAKADAEVAAEGNERDFTGEVSPPVSLQAAKSALEANGSSTSINLFAQVTNMSFNKLHPEYSRVEQTLPLRKIFSEGPEGDKKEQALFTDMCKKTRELLEKLSPKTVESQPPSARLRKIFFPLPNTWELFGLGEYNHRTWSCVGFAFRPRLNGTRRLSRPQRWELLFPRGESRSIDEGPW